MNNWKVGLRLHGGFVLSALFSLSVGLAAYLQIGAIGSALGPLAGIQSSTPEQLRQGIEAVRTAQSDASSLALTAAIVAAALGLGLGLLVSNSVVGPLNQVLQQLGKRSRAGRRDASNWIGWTNSASWPIRSTR
jgi:hypothetical protein